VLQGDGGRDPAQVAQIFSRAVRAGLHPQVSHQQLALSVPCKQYELLCGTQKSVVINACNLQKACHSISKTHWSVQPDDQASTSA
jgi:hypothetical protein